MVHFVGAGSGAADLITVRGARLLAEADVIIYAGSLVNPELLSYAKPGCEIHNSATMTLEEVIAVMRDAEAAGKTTVRLHTGDSSIYGAVREQFDELEKLQISYDVCPGVSAFCGAAAALKSRIHAAGCQPDGDHHPRCRKNARSGERIHPLACCPSGDDGAVSQHLPDRAAAKDLLAGGYAETTPAAVVYKATWRDQKIFRCTVGTLHKTVTQNGLTKTSLIVVGGCLGGEYMRSLLYHPGFSTRIPRGKRMTAAIFCYSRTGCETARRVLSAFTAHDTVCYTLARFAQPGFLPLEKGVYGAEFFALRRAHFHRRVRHCRAGDCALRPQQKTDPAVLVIDDRARFVIPILSGHIGGANALAQALAAALHAAAVITTATDGHGKFSVDAWAARNDCAISDMALAKAFSAAILERDLPLMSVFPIASALPGGIFEAASGKLGVYIGCDTKSPFEQTLRLIPKKLRVGVGCRRGICEEAVVSAIRQVLRIMRSTCALPRASIRLT